MSDFVRIRLHPLGRTLEVARGTPLQDILFEYGVEFPCGGQGRCKACRIRLLEGSITPDSEHGAILSGAEIDAGWRLACRCRAEQDLSLEIRQFESPILADSSQFSFHPEPGLGIAVDLGTTTLVAQLVDLSTGEVLGVESALNPQAAHGADIMSRVQHALTSEGRIRQKVLIRDCIGRMIASLLESAAGRARELARIVIVGNTVMHHLFCDIEVLPLSHYPFKPERDGLETMAASELGWVLPSEAPVHFLPCLGGFVGSDILAGILATRMHESREWIALVDLGTNGEVVVGSCQRIVCASAAAGPAFEGARIQMGMRAASGAIAAVTARQGRVRCRVLGGGAARGICGSGLVDAIAVGVAMDFIEPNGRFTGGRKEWILAGPVFIGQSDIRELQLAKGAIAAAIQLLLQRIGISRDRLSRVYLAGAFGNYIDRDSARRIGLLEFDPELVTPIGNSALLGAKIGLFESRRSGFNFAQLRSLVEHVPLSADPAFHDVFLESLAFPEPPPPQQNISNH